MYVLLLNYCQWTLNWEGRSDVQSFKHVEIYVYEFWGFYSGEPSDCSDRGPLGWDTL
jgi:hypothetical protein